MKYAHFFGVLGSSLVAVAAVGCGPAMEGDQDGVAGFGSGETVDSTTEAAGFRQCKFEDLKFYTLDTPLHQRIGTGNPSNTVCWLNNVAGNAINYKPEMNVTSDANGWYATGTMNSQVKVACAPLDCFYANQLAQDVSWASDTWTARSADARFGVPLATCSSGTSTGWMADSAVIFQGLEAFEGNEGMMVSTKDVAKTTQPESNRQFTSGTYTDCYLDGGSVTMFASNLFVGVPGGVHRPVFMGPLSGTSFGITGAGEYVAKSWDSSHYTEMRPVDEGICYFSSVSGGLKTASDGAEIFPVFKQAENKYRWVLRAEKLSGSNNSTNGIKATARCYKYKQAQ